MDVKLMYNPFFGTAKLYIDGWIYNNTAGRLYTYLSMPIEQWIGNTNKSYISWDGFFVELVDELNEDVINFTFLSDTRYFDMVMKSFEKQKHGIAQKGFCTDKFAISCRNVYEIEYFKHSLCNFINRHLNACKSQFYMETINFIYKDCQMLTADSDCFALYQRIIRVLEYGKDRAYDKDYWDDSIAEIQRIYDGKEV